MAYRLGVGQVMRIPEHLNCGAWREVARRVCGSGQTTSDPLMSREVELLPFGMSNEVFRLLCADAGAKCRTTHCAYRCDFATGQYVLTITRAGPTHSSTHGKIDTCPECDSDCNHKHKHVELKCNGRDSRRIKQHRLFMGRIRSVRPVWAMPRALI